MERNGGGGEMVEVVVAAWGMATVMGGRDKGKGGRSKGERGEEG